MMITSCDPINPYTTTETFGVPYNGGYKPDPNLAWIPPDTNIISPETEDDFSPPPSLPPPNMLMQTCEGRRIDPRVEIKGYKLEYDDYTVNQPVEVPKPAGNMTRSVKNNDEEMDWKLLTMLVLLVFLIWLITRFS